MEKAIRFYSKFGHTRKMADLVGRVICFSSAAIIESNYPKIKALFEAQGITVDERQFTCRGSMGPIKAGHPNQQDHDNLRAFIKSTL